LNSGPVSSFFGFPGTFFEVEIVTKNGHCTASQVMEPVILEFNNLHSYCPMQASNRF